MTEEYLFSVGYEKVNNNTYEKIDEETGMKVELTFDETVSQEDGDKIDQNIIKTLARLYK